MNQAILNEMGMGQAIATGSSDDLSKLHTRRTALLEPVRQAYRTLYGTYENLVRPRSDNEAKAINHQKPRGKSKDPAAGAEAVTRSLNAATEEMDNENSFSRRVNERVEQDDLDYDKVIQATVHFESE